MFYGASSSGSAVFAARVLTFEAETRGVVCGGVAVRRGHGVRV